MRNRYCCSWIVLLLLVLSGSMQAAEKEAGKPWDLMWAVKIPMRDGVKLNATVYRPHEQKEKLPVIFELTPYISDSYHERATYFAQHGYVFAIVDVRGRGNSEGKFNPFYQEPQDGHEQREDGDGRFLVRRESNDEAVVVVVDQLECAWRELTHFR